MVHHARCSQDRFRNNMANAPNNERVTAVKGDSLLSLSSLVAAGGTSTFDAIYVDGSHTVRALGCTWCPFDLRDKVPGTFGEK